MKVGVLGKNLRELIGMSLRTTVQLYRLTALAKGTRATQGARIRTLQPFRKGLRSGWLIKSNRLSKESKVLDIRSGLFQAAMILISG